MSVRNRSRLHENDIGAAAREPDASIVVPVNAQGDVDNVRHLLGDLDRYDGPHSIETILVFNNFPEGTVPAQVEEYRPRVDQVVAVPNVRTPGVAVPLAARMPGVRASRSQNVILFDADCRVPDPTGLIDWYVTQFRKGAQAAYTYVGYYDFKRAPTVYTYLAVHHVTRWVKRAVLRIPTTRGSSYAVRRDAMVELFDGGYLADDLNVGPAFKRLKGKVAYGAGRRLTVLTSGRMFRPGFRLLGPYLVYRLKYNVRVLPVRADAARYTGREKDPVRRYRNNKPIRAGES